MDITLRTITDSGIQILGRLSGNEKSDKLLVLSHGFGVKSDSRGMFDAISKRYANTYLIVQFHYVSVDDFTGNTYVYEYSKQVEKLATVIEKVTAKYGEKKISILGHSQGCLIPSLYLSQTRRVLEKLLLLAPALASDIKTKMSLDFGTRKGAVLDYTKKSMFPRSDGSKTYIPAAFWAGTVSKVAPENSTLV